MNQNSQISNKWKLGGVFCMMTVFVLLIASGPSSEGFGKGINGRVSVNLDQTTAKSQKDDICDLLEGDVKDGDVVDDDQREKWADNQESLQSARGDENQLKNYLKDEDTITPFIVTILTYAGIFLVFTVLSLIGFVTYIFCCVFEKCCPPCKLCCKCCQKEDEYKGLGLYWAPIGAAGFLFWIFVVCIVGLTTASGLKDSFNTFFCMSLTAFYGLNYGGGEFMGVNGLAQRLQDFNDQDMQGIIDTTAATFTGSAPEWTSLEKDELDYISAEMLVVCDSAVDCQECSGQTYAGTTPSPYPGSCTNGDWDQYAIVDFEYTTNPDGTAGTDTSIFFTQGVWEAQVEAIKDVYEATMTGIIGSIEAIEEAGGAINGQGQGLKTTMQSGIDDMDGIIGQLNDLISDQADLHDSLKGVMDGFTNLLITMYWIFIWLSIAGIVVGVLLFWRKIYCLRIALHGLWCFYSFFMIFTFLCSTIFTAMSLAGEQACDTLDGMFNDYDEFMSYEKFIGADTAEKIGICKRELNLADGLYGGDDNIGKAFGIEEQLDVINNMKLQILEFSNLAGSDSDTFQELQTVPNSVETLKDNCNTLRDTGVFESVPDQSDFLTVVGALDASGCAANTSDEFVAIDSDCTLTLSTYVAAGTTGSGLCFNVNDQTTLDAGRYTGGCASLTNDLTDLQIFAALKSDMANLKYEQSDSLKTQLEFVISLHGDYIDRVGVFTNTVVASLDKIGGDEGILNSIRCFWFGEQLDNFYDALCVSFVSNIYDLAFVSGFFSFGMYFASFFLFMTARRMAHNKKCDEKKKKVGLEEGPMTAKGEEGEGAMMMNDAPGTYDQ